MDRHRYCEPEDADERRVDDDRKKILALEGHPANEAGARARVLPIGGVSAACNPRGREVGVHRQELHSVQRPDEFDELRFAECLCLDANAFDLGTPATCTRDDDERAVASREEDGSAVAGGVEHDAKRRTHERALEPHQLTSPSGPYRPGGRCLDALGLVSVRCSSADGGGEHRIAQRTWVDASPRCSCETRQRVREFFQFRCRIHRRITTSSSVPRKGS